MLAQCFASTLPSCSSGGRQNRRWQLQILFVLRRVGIASGGEDLLTSVRVSKFDVVPFPNIHSHPCVSWRVLVSTVVICKAKLNDMTSPPNPTAFTKRSKQVKGCAINGDTLSHADEILNEFKGGAGEVGRQK